MSLERLHLLDSESLSGENILLCPKCQRNYLHHGKVEVLKESIHVYFYCELCQAGDRDDIRLVIRQHKGQTFMEWEKKQVNLWCS